MFIFFDRYLMDEANPDGGNGGGGATPDIKTLQADLEKYKSSAASLESKNQQILDELKKSKAALKNWEGLDPENVKTFLNKFENDEDMKLIAAGKHDEVIKKKTEKLQAEYNGKIQTLEEQLNSERESNKKHLEQIVSYKIDSNLGQLFLAEGGHKTAVSDFGNRARSVWKVEGDDLVPRNEKGEILQGKKGIMTPEEYIEKLKTDAPHLFPPSVGGKTTGNTTNPKIAALDAKMEAARKAGNTDEMRRLRALKQQAKE